LARQQVDSNSAQQKKLGITIGFMDTRLFDILVCPICKGRLSLNRSLGQLICKADRLAYPIRDGIPIMLENEAKKLDNTVELDETEAT